MCFSKKMKDVLESFSKELDQGCQRFDFEEKQNTYLYRMWQKMLKTFLKCMYVNRISIINQRIKRFF